MQGARLDRNHSLKHKITKLKSASNMCVELILKSGFEPKSSKQVACPYSSPDTHRIRDLRETLLDPSESR